jgi:hypothetical protein
MRKDEDRLGATLDRVERIAMQTLACVVSAGLGLLALWSLLRDDTPVHDGQIRAVLLFLFAGVLGLGCWMLPLFRPMRQQAGWKRLLDACMGAATFLTVGAVVSMFGAKPMPLWLAVGFIVAGFVLYMAALVLWRRNSG